MTYAQVLACFELSKLSPEELAHYLGVSNMTIRRWKKRLTEHVDHSYLAAIYQGILGLVGDGKLDMEHPQVKSILLSKSEGYNDRYAKAVLRSFGVTEPIQVGVTAEAQIQSSLAQSGSILSHQKRVQAAETEIKQFGDRGSDWKEKTDQLWAIVQNSTLSVQDRTIAIGALFYLLMTFDFIPDHLPVFGLLDDFALLGAALDHYRKNRSL
jgi:uncharacterized membrane protein YkvA (DUF1232 family)